MAMKQIKITSWLHFAEIAGLLDNGDPFFIPYAFRGQSDYTWDLTPSLLRLLANKSISEKEALNIESLAVDEFRSLAYVHLTNAELESTKSTFAWWSIMQHHGAPTRLLDWSASIYVAAYFAVISNQDKDGAVWLLHIDEAIARMNSKYGVTETPTTEPENINTFLQEEVPPYILFIGRKCKSVRMISQQGFFSVSRSVLGYHGEILGDIFSVSESEEYFRKLIIPASLKRNFLIKLRRMNVTASSLYPGLDGVGRSISELIQMAAE